MDSGPAIVAMRDVVGALSSGDSRDKIRTIQRAQDALDAQKSAALADLQLTREFELDGASSLSMWARNVLRLSARQAAELVKAQSTLTQLPAVAEAAASGLIRTDHVAAFTYGLKHIGFDTMAKSEPWLLQVARTCESLELFKVVRALREAVFPDELDKAWAEGMDKSDIQIVRVPGGWHVTGFLSAVIGAKFNIVLDAVAAPTDKDDLRSGSERRVDGLDKLLTRVLEGGMPSDKGIRPHLSVMVDADTLDAALDHRAGCTAQPGAPAQLAGYGSIGPQLLGYLACGTDITAILRRGNTTVLDVGRSHRLATLKQRRGILAKQEGVCATPGCHNTHLEIHHIVWWSRGGNTDFNYLIGLCTRCHHLVHRNLLNIRVDEHGEFIFTNQDNRALVQARRMRVARHREGWRIHRTALTMNSRRQERAISRT